MKNYLSRKAALYLAVAFLLVSNSFAEQKDTSLILGDYAVKNPKEIIEQAYKNAKWDDLSIEFRVVSLEPQEGFTAMKLNNPRMQEKVYYVSSKVDFDLKDISTMDVFYRPRMALDGALGVNVFFKNEAFDRFKDYLNKHINEFVGIIVNEKLIGAIKIMEPIEINGVGIGEFSVNEAIDIISKFFKPLKPIWRYFG